MNRAFRRRPTGSLQSRRVEPYLPLPVDRPRGTAGPVADAGTEPEDQLLLEQIRRGDVDALGALYDRWVERVYSVAVHVLGKDGRAAEDLVETVFRYVWREADHYHPGLGSVAAWLVLTTRSRALQPDLVRQRQVEPKGAALAGRALEHDVSPQDAREFSRDG